MNLILLIIILAYYISLLMFFNTLIPQISINNAVKPVLFGLIMVLPTTFLDVIINSLIVSIHLPKNVSLTLLIPVLEESIRYLLIITDFKEDIDDLDSILYITIMLGFGISMAEFVFHNSMNILLMDVNFNTMIHQTISTLLVRSFSHPLYGVLIGYGLYQNHVDKKDLRLRYLGYAIILHSLNNIAVIIVSNQDIFNPFLGIYALIVIEGVFFLYMLKRISTK